MKATPPPDNDRATRTLRMPTESTARAQKVKPAKQNELPVGTRLREFEITRLLGQGGFGIVYLAYDHSLHREVAVKEYMPASLAARGDNTTAVVKFSRYEETFQAGLRGFLEEARLLAQFDHPSLVKVYRYWEDNGTAYMVMPFYQGVTLEEKLALMSSPPDEAWLKKLLIQLLEALKVIHAAGCLHRDIAPDNIWILPDGRPLLLDFGAARRVIGEMTQALTVILKPGYAPVEQYANDPAMKQGTWTDIYALGGVVYYAITGQAPVPSVSRIISDAQIPLSKAAAGRYSASFLKAIDSALAVKPDARPQNVEEVGALLGLDRDHAQYQKKKTPSGSQIAVLVTVTAAIGIGIFFARDKPSPTEGATNAVTSPPGPASTMDEKRFEPLKALDEIFEGRDRNHAVTVSTGKAQTRIGRDPLRFTIRSAKAGYVYVLMVGTNGSDFFLLFPNAVDKNNRVKAGEQLDLPRPQWKMIAEGPPGTDHFLVIVSEQPRDLTPAGLEPVDIFAEFPLEKAQQLYAAHAGPDPLFAGKAICPDSRSDCSELYGAAVFSIEEIQGP